MNWTANDLEPPLTGNVMVDLTAATTVTVHIRRPDGTVIGRAVTLGDQTAAAGSWSMPLVAGDLSLPGGYTVEIEAMWQADRPQTFRQPSFQVGRELIPGPIVPPESPPGSGLYLTSLVESPVGSGLYQIGA